jgi:Ran GTPase-activating protein (RanGAP) involved in mRNA processing and transport
VFGALRDNTQSQITKWDLSAQALSAEAITSLMEYLSASRTLTEANLIKNEMDDETAASLAALSKRKKIALCSISPEMSVADVSGKALRSTDCVLIAAAIDFRPSLVSIDVSHNEIGQAASLELIAALKARDVQRLSMAGCSLGVDGANAVATLPSFCKTMVECNLRSNQLGEGWTAVFDALGAKKVRDTAKYFLKICTPLVDLPIGPSTYQVIRPSDPSDPSDPSTYLIPI